MGNDLWQRRRRRREEKEFAKRFEASRSERAARLREVLSEREVEIHLVPPEKEKKEREKTDSVESFMTEETVDKLRRLGWKGEQGEVVQKKAEMAKSPQIFFVDDEWDEEEVGEAKTPPERDGNEEENEGTEGAGGRQVLDMEFEAREIKEMEAMDPRQQLLLDPHVRMAFQGDANSQIPYEVLLKVARAFDSSFTTGAEKILHEEDEKKERRNGADLGNEFEEKGVDTALIKPRLKNDVRISDETDESDSTDSDSKKQEPSSPAIIPPGHPFSLEDVTFLPNFTKRRNRTGLFRGNVVELHVVKLGDILAMVRYKEEFQKTLRSLDHPNVIRVQGVNKRKDNLYVVATDFRETSLREALDAGYNISYPFVLRFAFQVCGALLYLHRQDLIHYNVYAESLFFDGKQPPSLHLLDIGIGRALFGPNISSPVIPPERLRKRRGMQESDFTTALDVYNLGFVLWEMLTSTRADVFMKVSDSEEETMNRHLQCWERPPLLAVPLEFRQLLSRCWAEEPKERPSVEEILKELRRLIILMKERHLESGALDGAPMEISPNKLNPKSPFFAMDLSAAAVLLRKQSRLQGKRRLIELCSLLSLQNLCKPVKCDTSYAYFRPGSVLNVAANNLERLSRLRIASRDWPEFSKRLEKLKTTFSCQPGILCVKYVSAKQMESDAEVTEVTMHFPYVNGGSLEDIIDRGGCSDPAFLSRLAWGMLHALGWLHRFNFVHGSLLPSQVLCKRDGQVYISGCELASPNDLNAVHLHSTRWRDFSGQYGFFAPETILSDKVSAKSDIYSLGMCLLVAATSEIPKRDVKSWETMRKNVLESGQCMPDFPEGIVSEKFQDFVRKCLLFDTEERPTTEDLLLHPFLSDFWDYAWGGIGKDPDMIQKSSLPNSVVEGLAEMEDVVLSRLESFVVRNELDSLLPYLNPMVEDNDTDDNTKVQVGEGLVHDLTSMPLSFVTDELVNIVSGSLPGFDSVDVGASVQEIDIESFRADPMKALHSMFGTYNVVLICGGDRKSDSVSWKGALDSLVKACKILPLWSCDLQPEVVDALRSSKIARLYDLDGQPSDIETLVNLGHDISRVDVETLVLCGAVAPTGPCLEEQVLARISASVLAASNKRCRFVRPFSTEGFLSVFSTVMHHRHNPKPHDCDDSNAMTRAKYDVFVGSSQESSKHFSHVLLSWNATKPEDMVLAYVRAQELQSKDMFQHLERIVNLELASNVLFYYFPAGDGPHSLGLLVRAGAHATSGKPVVMVFGDESGPLYELARDQLETAHAKVYLFPERELDLAIEKAIELRVALEIDDPTLTLLEFKRDSNERSVQSVETAKLQPVPVALRLLDALNDAVLSDELTQLFSRLGSRWSVPPQILQSLEEKSRIWGDFVKNFEVNLGRGVRQYPPQVRASVTGLQAWIAGNSTDGFV